MSPFQLMRFPKTAVELLVYLGTIFFAGWVFHQNVVSALESRFKETEKAAYPRVLGENLEKNMHFYDERLDERLTRIESDIKELLKRSK